MIEFWNSLDNNNKIALIGIIATFVGGIIVAVISSLFQKKDNKEEPKEQVNQTIQSGTQNVTVIGMQKNYAVTKEQSDERNNQQAK